MKTSRHLASCKLLMLLLWASVTNAQEPVRRPTMVKRGREVFLCSSDLQHDLGFSSDAETELCRIHVVTDDPVTLRVGRVEPLDFKCTFSDNTVRYIHNGNPLLNEDVVRLEVFKFNGVSVTRQLHTFMVSILDAPHSILVDNPRLKKVTVRRQLGLSTTIGMSNIRFRYNYNSGASCTLTYTYADNDLPVAGDLVDRDGVEVTSLSRDCREWLMSGMRYKHRHPATPEKDYLPFEVEVEDTDLGNGVVKERFYLPVNIEDSQHNTPPSAAIQMSSILEIEQYRLLILDPGIISASDRETSTDQLVFNITKQPSAGFFINTENPSRVLYSFSQSELIKGHIAYNPRTEPLSDLELIECEMVVYDSHYMTSEPLIPQITVTPTQSNGPKVVLNRGLVVYEGLYSAITPGDLRIYDRDNPEGVRFQLRGGPRYGRLELDGLPAKSFTSEDIEAGRVVYRHGGNEASEDKIILRITDGTSTVRVKVTITILPDDDTAPYLVINEGLEVVEGGYVCITNEHLAAHDKDSVDEKIEYHIKTPPRVGEILKRYQALVAGWPVSVFTQMDIDRGLIYYRHLGGEDVSDRMEIRVADTKELPNKSSKYSVDITILKSQNLPPMQVSGTTRHIEARETDVVKITKDQLWYEDLEHPQESLVYTITSQPYFVSTPITIDAGKIIITSNMTSPVKNSTLLPISKFTQTDINQHKIAYMPPWEDVGPIRRQARFVFAVSDSGGNHLIEQAFDVTILPVDNLLPHMTVRALSTREGGHVRLTGQYINSYDPDTEQELLVYTVEEAPRYGQLLLDDARLVEGERFTQNQMTSSNIRYEHDGSETLADTFALSISDGIHKVTEIIPVNIQLVLDQRPEPVREALHVVRLAEGTARVLSGAHVGFLQRTPTDMSRVFMVIKSPMIGEIRNEGVKVNDFSLRDLWSSRISYVHTGGETGADEVHDSATLMVADQEVPPPAGTKPLIDLNITITPVDNTPPELHLGGPMFVYENQRSPITAEVLSVSDIDSHRDDISIVISQTPRWGHIRHAQIGHGRGHVVSHFTLDDIEEEVILYAQGSQNGTEPIMDRFTVHATDGKHNSTPQEIEVSIIPDNLQLPTFEIHKIHVLEGESEEFELVIGEDGNWDDALLGQLLMSVTRQPVHGELIMQMNSIDGRVEVEEEPLTSVTLSDLPGMHLVYRHDGSDSEQDSFTIRLSDGFHSNHHVVNVKIKPVNDETPIIRSNAVLKVNYGASRPIDRLSLEAVDADNSPSELIYVIITEPRKGIVQILKGSEWVHLPTMSNFTQEDINNNSIRYLHMRGLSEFTMDDLVFELTDGVHVTDRDTFIVDIGLLGTSHIAVLNRGMTATQHSHEILTCDMLSAFDGSKIPQDLVFVITSPPRHGILSMVTNKHLPASSFSQADIQAQKIIYTHSGASGSLEDSFVFTAVNGLNHSISGEFHINISSSDRHLPSLNVNVPLTVVQGERVALTGRNLHAVDPDTVTDSVQYILLEPPQYGNLLKQGFVVTDIFTQHDLDEGHMEYNSDSSDDSGVDFFLFSISDGQNNGFLINGTLEDRPAFFNILIQPLTKEPPTLVNNNIPNQLENLGDGRNGFILNDRLLKAEHASSESRHIIYSLRRNPRHGFLEHLGADRPISRKFTQQDIDDGRVAYILEEATSAVNDSFTFRVHDLHRNTLDDQTFVFEWSLVAFEQPQYIVCEDAAIVPVVITRQGSLNSTVRVEVRSKQMSAKEGLDYIPNPINVLTFAPGATRAEWNLEIIQDVVRDGNEKFKLLLRNPDNAVLPENDKAVVQIVDFEDGHCPEYIGIISRSRPREDTDVLQSRTGQADDFGDTEDGDDRVDSARSNSQLLESDPSFYHGQDLDDTRTGDDEQQMWKWNYDRDDDSETGAHPLHKYGRKKKRKKRRRHNDSNGTTTSTASPPTTTASPTSVPQQCTRDTKGLLYIDMLTSRMYRCSGVTWQPWSYGDGGSYPSLLTETDDGPDDNEHGNGPSGGRRRKKCASGWSRYRDSCHKMVTDKESWSIGEHRCAEMGGHLTHVASSKHMEFLWQLAGEESFWIGLNAQHRGNGWEWTNTAPLRFYNWRHGFPKQRGAFSKKCVLVSRRSEWVNRPCDTVTARFICSQPVRNHTKRAPR